MEFKKEYMIGVGIIVLAFLVWWFYSSKKPSPSASVEKPTTIESAKNDKVIIYGSLGCPYTVKQMGKFPNHEFVDCTSQKCPEFVTAYPTTKMPDGRIEVGFS